MSVRPSKRMRAALILVTSLVGLGLRLGEMAPGDDGVAGGRGMRQVVSSMSDVGAGVAHVEDHPGAVTVTGARRDVLVVAVLRALDAGHVPFGGPALWP